MIHPSYFYGSHASPQCVLVCSMNLVGWVYKHHSYIIFHCRDISQLKGERV